MTWHPLTSSEQLDTLLAESADRPVAVFKHSTKCSISAAAKTRLERQWDDAIGDSVTLYYLDLLRYRTVSTEVATRLHVIHESPQLLLIQNGRCTYNASHFAIRSDTVKQRLELV